MFKWQPRVTTRSALDGHHIYNCWSFMCQNHYTYMIMRHDVVEVSGNFDYLGSFNMQWKCTAHSPLTVLTSFENATATAGIKPATFKSAAEHSDNCTTIADLAITLINAAMNIKTEMKQLLFFLLGRKEKKKNTLYVPRKISHPQFQALIVKFCIRNFLVFMPIDGTGRKWNWTTRKRQPREGIVWRC